VWRTTRSGPGWTVGFRRRATGYAARVTLSHDDAAGPTDPSADGGTSARTQTEQVNEELQEENAETSLDQPSDGSGSE
jgi:hypothetical protein